MVLADTIRKFINVTQHTYVNVPAIRRNFENDEVHL